MKLFLDTNVLIDLFGHRDGFYDDALKLVGSHILGDTTLWASAKSFTDIFYVLMRCDADPNALQKAFIASLDFLNICALDQDDIADAATQDWSDFEDCLIAMGAAKVEADFIITRDEAGFDRSPIPALSPDAFFQHLQETHSITYDFEPLL